MLLFVRYNTEPVLDTLTKEFSLVNERKNIGEKSVEIRTKIGVEYDFKTLKINLIRCLSRRSVSPRDSCELSELTPKYKNILLNTFFSSNDPSPLVRSSSLSNLGEVCANLRFSLGGVAGEVLHHLEVSAADVDVGVRRAAVMVVTLLLQGLGTDMFTVLNKHIRDLYRGLKTLAVTETDVVTLAHVNITMDDVDKIVRL